MKTYGIEFIGRNNEPLSEHGSDDPERGLKRERGIGVFDHMDYNRSILSFYLMACSHWQHWRGI